jgi:hypothetical protein
VAEDRLLLVQGEEPVLLARVVPSESCVNVLRTGLYRSPLPPLRADHARRLAGSAPRWGHYLADVLAAPTRSPLHDGRWTLSSETSLLPWNRHGRSAAEWWGSMLVEGDPVARLDWWRHMGEWEILPMRAVPDAEDGRVKAYRKLARDGILPPVLLWWISGFDCHVVLDGHARLAAALAESIEVPVMELHRTVPHDEKEAGTKRATAVYEAELNRFADLRNRARTRARPTTRSASVPDGSAVAGPALAAALAELDAARRPTWC